MKHLSGRILIAFVITTIVGAGLHFLYDFWPNWITALVSPVSESLWEHVKTIFFPLLAASLLLTRKESPGNRAPWLLSLILVCVLMLAAGYVYHIFLSGETTAVDVAIYVICMALGFVLPGFLAEPLGGRFVEPLSFLTAVMALLIIIFTFMPPELILFMDFSTVNTFRTIPY